MFVTRGVITAVDGAVINNSLEVVLKKKKTAHGGLLSNAPWMTVKPHILG
jgi:hypothetical protein